MAEVTASAIKQLREKTGAGMLDCKKALSECGGNEQEAVDWLRTKGLAAAAKKSGRAATEGLVAVALQDGKGALIELNAETDFVARNDKFQNLALKLAETALGTSADLDALVKANFPDSSRTVEEEITEAISVIGENMQLRRSTELSGQIVISYIHNSVAPNIGKIGVLVALKSDGNIEKVRALGTNIAMHVAASKPESLDVASLDQQLIERERNVLSEQAKESGKPDNVIEKMVEGRLHKFYKEVVLLEQPFIIDGKTPIKDILKEQAKEAGGNIEITGFVRFALGEGLEKKEEDFAAEVAAAAGGKG